MEQEPNIAVAKQETRADSVSSWIIIGLMFLLPVFFIPSVFVPFQFAKVFLVYAGVMAALVAWIVARLKDGKVLIARPDLSIALGLIAVIYGISAVFSPVRAVSFLGQGYEIGTFAFIIAMLVLLFIASNLFNDRRKIAYAYGAFLASFVVIALYQFLRLLVGPSFLSFGILTGASDNLIGSWSDLGIYFGAVALFAIVSLEFLNLPRRMKYAGIAVLAVSLFFLSVINFTTVWYMLGIFSFILFIYNFSLKRSSAIQAVQSAPEEKPRTLPLLSLTVLIISFVFVLFQGNIYATLSGDLGMKFFGRFAISNLEVRPSWKSTASIAKDTFFKDPIIGTGPNRFTEAWLRSKPADINSTIFWSTDFNYAIGLIPTFLVTTGALGFLSWLALILLFVYAGFRTLFVRRNGAFGDYLSISSFAIALYFWIFAFFHVPSAPIVAAMFVFTGIFFATSLGAYSFFRSRTYDIVRDPRASFVSVLVLITLLLGVMIYGYTIGKKFIASVYFNQAIASANIKGDVVAAEASLFKALRFDEQDIYYRNLSELNLAKLNVLLNQQGVSEDKLKADFQSGLGTAQAAAQAALNLDKTKYENWLTLAHVYEMIVPLKIEGAYTQAVSAYAEAQKLNPNNPSIPLQLARLEVANSNVPKAKENIILALQLKNNYTDAVYYLAQLQIAEGDLKSAIKSVEAAATINPNDPAVYFQLGLLRYNDKDYKGASSAFEQAVNFVPDYANAKYFLGLSYDKLDRAQDALKQFADIKALNPENAEVGAIIENLQSGRDALSGIKSASGAVPEPVPPVKEKDSVVEKEAETADR